MQGTLPDHFSVLRMVWSPSHYDNGELTGACFTSNDLLGVEGKDGVRSFISVDCESEILQSAIDRRINYQTRDDFSERYGRHEVRFVRWICKDIKGIKESSESPYSAFTVEREQTLDNPAHCGIKNVSSIARKIEKKITRAHVDYLRKELIKYHNADLGYADVFQNKSG